MYQRCFYDDFPNNNEKVEFYIGEHDNVDGHEWFLEDECLSGLSKLLRKNLMCQINFLFGNQVVGLAQLMPALVNQILFLAEDEPYGVRGADVIVAIERPLVTKKPSVMSTTSSSSSVMSEDHGENDILNIGHIKMCKDTVG